MKVIALSLTILVAIVVYVQCDSIFMGSNIMRTLAFHKEAKYGSKLVQKRIEYLNYTVPAFYGPKRTIAGIIAYDLTHSGATANITRGGVGYNFVNLRMKSDRGKQLKYDVSIYV